MLGKDNYFEARRLVRGYSAPVLLAAATLAAAGLDAVTLRESFPRVAAELDARDKSFDALLYGERGLDLELPR